ncbi:MAG: hypothetical protein LBQ97_09395 [Fusobacteriaceae bacterium]|jgi:hypothetical protein|nr:hypothetical protein [Fusobacteriaceae bacterium]
MGLFDKILKQKLGEVLSDAAGKVIEKATQMKEEIEKKNPTANTPQPTRSPVYGGAAAERKDAAWFSRVIAESFPGYEVQANVPVASLGGSGKSYDFGIYRGGSVAGVVMLTPHNRDRNRAFLGAKNAAKSAGVPFINFYLHMPNERDYVIKRIQAFLALSR